ncbi:MAG TPA: NAD(P)/FAD-dependent oxidoreductase [Sphaerochaeta sp.]|nr:NAD(P)/FAD-dependent oxidoreductase [Sphaerochaeta sp.]
MIKDISLRLSPKAAFDIRAVQEIAAKEARFPLKEVTGMRILRRSVDARRDPPVIDMNVRLFTGSSKEELFEATQFPFVGDKRQVIVVGAGPAGLFASLRLIEIGLKPILLERGVNVHQRKKDIAAISTQKKVNSESNYNFGEGGAGAFSDGKLYTRATKRGNVGKILSLLCQHGASSDILFEAHPHLGTDKLPQIIEKIRNTILASGAQVHFSTKVVSFIKEKSKVVGVVTENGETFIGPVILATGHSARDIYEYMEQEKIAIEAKSLAIGVRLEHPQKLIDRIQYKNYKGKADFLPAAEYSFVTQVDGRGVYSFCMCPGGFVIPAMSTDNQMVVNGMSSSSRKGPFANSGMVVELYPEDLPQDQFEGNLKVMHYLQSLEESFYKAGGGSLAAPAQRMADFVNHRPSKDLPPSSYGPGLANADLHQVLPPFISERLATAFSTFGRKAQAFLTNDALLIAGETRTSSPVRILRNKETNMHIELAGLFPCGEGAGYAGGIVSAALDGVNCADSVFEYLGCEQFFPPSQVDDDTPSPWDRDPTTEAAV